jgi:hypothetical protein
MKHIQSAIVCLSLSLALAAPSLSAQKKKPAHKPAAAPQAAPVAIPSPIDSTLADLERITAATDNDIANLKSEKKSFSWKTAWMFWRKDSSRNPQTDRFAGSLQRNLHDAMPGLIHDARNSPGNFSATFRLYNNLSVVCELLDSLVDSTKNGKKDGDGALTADSAAMGRIRQDVATYVEQMAAALDKGRLPLGWSPSVSNSSTASNGKPKRIIIDDTIPERKASSKASQQ